MKDVDLNQEKIRVRLVEIYEEYIKKADASSIKKMKEIVKEYDAVRELLDETLNCALGILEAISNKEIKDKKEEKQLLDSMTKELNEKSYLGGGEGESE